MATAGRTGAGTALPLVPASASNAEAGKGAFKIGSCAGIGARARMPGRQWLAAPLPCLSARCGGRLDQSACAPRSSTSCSLGAQHVLRAHPGIKLCREAGAYMGDRWSHGERAMARVHEIEGWPARLFHPG